MADVPDEPKVTICKPMYCYGYRPNHWENGVYKLDSSISGKGPKPADMKVLEEAIDE